jgi:hypothetical protein
MDGQTGDVYYALHCISENNISKLSTIYTAEQLEVLKAALEIIITKNGRFKSKKIVKIMFNKNVKFHVIKDIYHTIDEFVKEKYFHAIGDHYYISPRGLIEFNTYFRTYFKDFVRDCVLCKAICIRPLECKHCKVPYHKICSSRFSEQQDKCINCSNAFELNESVDSVRSEDQARQKNQIQQIAEWLNASDAEEGNESEVDSDVGETMEVDRSQRQNRSQYTQ